MYTHVMVGTNDKSKAEKFYDATLGALGIKQMMPGSGNLFYGSGFPAFGVGSPRDGAAASHANGGTIGFSAPNREAVDAFHAAGLANGGSCEGPPGVRETAPGKPYGAYLRDPDGNKICTFAPAGA